MSRDTRYRDDGLLGLIFMGAGVATVYFALTPVLSAGLFSAGLGTVVSAQYAKGRNSQDLADSRTINLLTFWILASMGVTSAGGGIAVVNAGFPPLAGYALWGLGGIFVLIGLAGLVGAFDSVERDQEPETTETSTPTKDASEIDTVSVEREQEPESTEITIPIKDASEIDKRFEQQAQHHHENAIAALDEGRLEDAESELREAATIWVEASSEPGTTTKDQHSALREALERLRAGDTSEELTAEIKEARQSITSQADRSDDDQDAQESISDGIIARFNGTLGNIRSSLSQAETAVEQNHYELAERRVESARGSLADASELLEEHELPQEEDLEDYEEQIAELQGTIEEERAEFQDAVSSFSGMLGSIGAGLSKAEDRIESGEFTKAESRIESAETTLDRAKEFNQEHSLGREDALAERQQRIESLRDAITREEETYIRELLQDAEAAVANGITHRDNQAYPDAVEEFSKAIEQYEQAVALVNDRDRPEAWEVEERHSMVSDYLERTEDELAERRQAVHQDLSRELETAEERLARAEQFVEVNDTGSARDALEKGVRSLDQAAQLIATGVADDSYQTEAETLVTKAESLHAQLPEIGETPEYRTQDLVQYLQELTAKLTESPRPELLNKYGKYPADAYLDAFGSWPEALAAANLEPVDEDARDRRKYTRTEVLDAIAALWEDLGHPPDTGDMNKHGRMSASPVSNRFISWDAAIDLVEAARAREETQSTATEPPTADRTSTASSTEPTDRRPANELAELYDSFRSLETILEAVLDADDSVSPGDGSPFTEWHDMIVAYTYGEGRDGEPSLGAQQEERNSVTMDEYRSEYGDGEMVTEFHAIETRGLKASHREQFIEAGLIDSDSTFTIPVAPESGTQLPIAVRTRSELEKARELLNEFPARPSGPSQPEDDKETTTEIDGETTDKQTAEDESSGEDDIVSQLLEDMGFDGKESTSD